LAQIKGSGPALPCAEQHRDDLESALMIRGTIRFGRD